MSRPALIAAAALLAACPAHVQQDGPYAFAADEVIRDDCGLLATPDSLWDGRLIIAGDIVRMDYELFAMQLAGAYQETVERFYLDGSTANVTTRVGASDCLLEQVNVHLVAESSGVTAFAGDIRVEYRAKTSGCVCDLWARYRAARVQ